MDNGERWTAINASADNSAFDVALNERILGRVSWPLLGLHNASNALGAIAAARHAGVAPELAVEALADFSGVKRRLEVIAEVGETTLYDDFAHHPTAIRKTLQGLRNSVGGEEILAIIEPRTHTMALGTLRDALASCCAAADQAFWFRSANIEWDLAALTSECVVPAQHFADLPHLIKQVCELPKRRRHVVIMSNGGFDNIYEKLPAALRDS